MIPFLQQVATRYVAEAGNSLGDYTFVFPNRRAGAFFRKYLLDTVPTLGPGHAVFAPKMLTINDFFYEAAGVETTDRIQLLLELYEAYRALNPKAEPLDEFVFWGDVLLGDFDDLDKYRVDARGLFANVSDLKAIGDSYSYLSETQRSAIEAFIRHFRDDRGRLTVRLDADDPKIKERFLHIWNLLLPLYTAFRERLRSRGMAYEGMVYRTVAERLEEESAADLFPGEKYVFVGLNALNECEKAVLGKMRDAGKAAFVWDYVSEMIRHPENKSSLFLRENVVRFPQAFPLEDDPKHVPEVEVISVPSAVGQTKLLPDLLAGTDPGAALGTAVVLPDESLLTPVLHTIPPAFTDINVTMGFPLRSGAVATLLKNAAALQLSLRSQGGNWFFYHRPVTALLSGSLIRRILTSEEQEVVRRVQADPRYYVPAEALRGGPFLDLLFRPVITVPKEADPEQIRRIALWQKEILALVGERLTRDDGMLLELDLTKRCYQAVEILSGKEALQGILPATWFRLLERLLAAQSVPFNGEPLKGLQVMGPLETRALDFDTVILLSANEGTFPRRSVSSSFIPPELRRGFGLPTYEFQDAVWAYYFYRLLQRARRVVLVYDSRSEGLHSGEESRYVKQLQYFFGVPLRRRVVLPALHAPKEDSLIPKTAEDLAALHARPLSASSITNYLYCPAKFYYGFVRGLAEEDEIAETLDESMIGNVYHAVMQSIYLGGEALEPEFPVYDRDAVRERIREPLRHVTPSYIESLLTKEGLARIRAKVSFLIRTEMRSLSVSGRNIVVANVIFAYVKKTLERDLELALRCGGFEILGLEKRMTWQFGGFGFVGYIDRMDRLPDGTVRIIDYKTGRVKTDDTAITDDNAAAIADKLFGSDNKSRPKIAFQLFLYDMFTRAVPAWSDAPIENGIYSPADLFVHPVETRGISPAFSRLVRERLRDTLAEMDDPAVPFRRTEQTETCGYCDFKMICGR